MINVILFKYSTERLIQSSIGRKVFTKEVIKSWVEKEFLNQKEGIAGRKNMNKGTEAQSVQQIV